MTSHSVDAGHVPPEIVVVVCGPELEPSLHLQELAGRFALCVVHNPDSRSARHHACPSVVEGVRLLCNEENLGFGRAADQAIRTSSAETVVLLNPDAQASCDAIDALVRAREVSGFAALATTLQRPNGDPDICGGELISVPACAKDAFALTGRPIWSTDVMSPGVVRRMPWVAFTLVALSRSAYVRVGGFDSDFFLYYEDMDLCDRFRRAGSDVGLFSVGAVVHAGQGSTQLAAARIAAEAAYSLRTYLDDRMSGPGVVLCGSLIMLAWVRRAVERLLKGDGASCVRYLGNVAMTWRVVVTRRVVPRVAGYTGAESEQAPSPVVAGASAAAAPTTPGSRRTS